MEITKRENTRFYQHGVPPAAVGLGQLPDSPVPVERRRGRGATPVHLRIALFGKGTQGSMSLARGSLITSCLRVNPLLYSAPDRNTAGGGLHDPHNPPAAGARVRAVTGPDRDAGTGHISPREMSRAYRIRRGSVAKTRDFMTPLLYHIQ